MNNDDNELDIARKMAAGELPSPQQYKNVTLFAIRITGTGTAYRSNGDEFCYRPPEHYLNDDFLARCNGLTVIFEHPEKPLLTSEEFNARKIGSIFLPYIQGSEVWGIAKIYDESAITIMSSKQISTSPGVYLKGKDKDIRIKFENGDKLLLEGDPELLDHIAVCEYGVWDKGGKPSGVLNSNLEHVMTEEELKAKKDADEAAQAKKDAELQGKLDAMQSKMDAMQAKMDAMPSPEMTAADKAKKDAEEKEKKDAAEAEEKAKADAQTKKDAALQAKIDALEAVIPKALSDADAVVMADCQIKADSIAHAFGDSAPRPLQGETVLAYRKRLAAKFKDHSPAWKSVDLSAINDAAVLNIAEKQIYNDAMTAARNPVAVPGQGLREIIRRSPAGHQVSTFIGDIKDFTSQFKPPVRRFVEKFNKPNTVQ